MIAKIYPDNHPELQGKKDPKHPVRYFDIRKLTPPNAIHSWAFQAHTLMC